MSFKLRRWISCVAFPFLDLFRKVVYLIRRLNFFACLPLDCGDLQFHLDNAGHVESLGCDLQLTVVDFCAVACIALRTTLSSRTADAADAANRGEFFLSLGSNKPSPDYIHDVVADIEHPVPSLLFGPNRVHFDKTPRDLIFAWPGRFPSEVTRPLFRDLHVSSFHGKLCGSEKSTLTRSDVALEPEACELHGKRNALARIIHRESVCQMICSTCQSVFDVQLDNLSLRRTLHQSIQSLYASAEFGCFICSLYWTQVQRAAQRLEKDPLEINGKLILTLSPSPETSTWQASELNLIFEGDAVVPLSFWLVPYRGNR